MTHFWREWTPKHSTQTNPKTPKQTRDGWEPPEAPKTRTRNPFQPSPFFFPHGRAGAIRSQRRVSGSRRWASRAPGSAPPRPCTRPRRRSCLDPTRPDPRGEPPGGEAQWFSDPGKKKWNPSLGLDRIFSGATKKKVGKIIGATEQLRKSAPSGNGEQGGGATCVVCSCVRV